MQQYRIIGRDERGETVECIRMSKWKMAEMVFYGITHDDEHQGLNWSLEVRDCDGDWIAIDWHCPLNKATA